MATQSPVWQTKRRRELERDGHPVDDCQYQRERPARLRMHSQLGIHSSALAVGASALRTCRARRLCVRVVLPVSRQREGRALCSVLPLVRIISKALCPHARGVARCPTRRPPCCSPSRDSNAVPTTSKLEGSEEWCSWTCSLARGRTAGRGRDGRCTLVAAACAMSLDAHCSCNHARICSPWSLLLLSWRSCCAARSVSAWMTLDTARCVQAQRLSE